MSDPRPTVLEVVLRFGLGLFGLFLLWRVAEPELLAIPTANTIGQIEPTSLSTLLLEVVVGTVAGAVFALAARPIWGAWTYRWRLPAVIAILPATILVVEVLVLAGVTPLPDEGLWRSTAVFLISSFTLRVTAILLGVSLAQGVVANEAVPMTTETLDPDAAAELDIGEAPSENAPQRRRRGGPA